MRHRIPRRNLAPADRQIPFKGDEPGRRSGIDDRAEGLLVFVAIPFPVLGTNPPIHAPAAIAGPARSKQVLESRPEIRTQRPHVQIERACSLPFGVHQCAPPSRPLLRPQYLGGRPMNSILSRNEPSRQTRYSSMLPGPLPWNGALEARAAYPSARRDCGAASLRPVPATGGGVTVGRDTRPV